MKISKLPRRIQATYLPRRDSSKPEGKHQKACQELLHEILIKVREYDNMTGVDVLDVYYEEGEAEGRRQASREMTSLARDYL